MRNFFVVILLMSIFWASANAVESEGMSRRAFLIRAGAPVLALVLAPTAVSIFNPTRQHKLKFLSAAEVTALATPAHPVVSHWRDGREIVEKHFGSPRIVISSAAKENSAWYPAEMTTLNGQSLSGLVRLIKTERFSVLWDAFQRQQVQSGDDLLRLAETGEIQPCLSVLDPNLDSTRLLVEIHREDEGTD